MLKVSLNYFASAGGWTASTITYTLRWQNGRFEMIGFDRSDTERNTGVTTGTSINYLTRKKQITTGSIENDKKKTVLKTISAQKLLTIEAIGDGFEFDPDNS